jgi:acetyl-CoA synthase
VSARLNKAAKELYGIDGFADMICDESIASDTESVVAYLKEKKHPAFGMTAIM